MKEISSRSFATKAPGMYKNIRDRWAELGRALEKYDTKLELDDRDIKSAFLGRSRCAWSKCLCSIYKPVHALRVCKGCWRVAYCGPKCQKTCVDRTFFRSSFLRLTALSDWYDGSHGKSRRGKRRC